ncbi:Putative motility protein [Devosia lucknowensis]|uniref:Putative motility protein n=1 Tax=Devosia lucknowensis TaxID=1096929 RepID=A0A1Y6GDX9_9HYPH|nr:putative motility protein [Devosia lucknowensis]SMQ86289.1 Putative motility protein [Devosia lucknowensis]
MNTDLATNLLTARMATTQNAVQIAVVKKSHEMEMELVNSLMQTALSPPPPGQGTLVDKQA